MEAVRSLGKDELRSLRDAVRSMLGEDRFSHTLAVEEEIAEMARLYLPQSEAALRVAALLHDITKEWTREEQERYCKIHAIPISAEEAASEASYHSKTAPFFIRERFPELADPRILQAIERHTIGAPNMTLFEKLLFLADFIEPTRRWEACKSMRAEFWHGLYEMSERERLAHLDRILLKTLAFTIRFLAEHDRLILPDTVLTYNALLADIKQG